MSMVEETMVCPIGIDDVTHNVFMKGDTIFDIRRGNWVFGQIFSFFDHL